MDIQYYYENTELSILKIAEILSVTPKTIEYYVNKHYSKAYRNLRKKKTYRNSKLGDKNPSFNKKGTASLKYKGIISDGRGYSIVLKPDWYTGRKNSKHVFHHHVVWCEHHKFTEIPKGYVVHHCDYNKINNNIENLICMSMADHQRLHAWLKSVTTISKESTAKWLEAHGRDWFL